jgi:hypothetical protein
MALVLLPACVAAGMLFCMIGRMCCAFWVPEGLRIGKWKALIRKRAATLY